MGLAVIKLLPSVIYQFDKPVREIFSDWDIAKHNWISQPFNINIRGNTTPFTDCPERVN
jgi:hypothetical protein